MAQVARKEGCLLVFEIVLRVASSFGNSTFCSTSLVRIKPIRSQSLLAGVFAVVLPCVFLPRPAESTAVRIRSWLPRRSTSGPPRRAPRAKARDRQTTTGAGPGAALLVTPSRRRPGPGRGRSWPLAEGRGVGGLAHRPESRQRRGRAPELGLVVRRGLSASFDK